MSIARYIIVLLLFAVSIYTQDAFQFHAQQSVYIVAIRGNTGDPSLSSLDLAAEKEIREGFIKRGVFTIADSSAKADFIFLCITEYLDNTNTSLLRNVLAMALGPNDFTANRSDLTKMRDLALWQNSRSAKVRVKLKSVMNDFQDFTLKK